MIRGFPRTARPAAVAALLAVGAAAPAVAQTSRLDAADSLAARGELARARDSLSAWWEDDASGASRHAVQRGLWLRGKLSLDGDDAVDTYRRLVVEYPGGPYTDLALFRLGLSARARGEDGEAAAYFRRLVRDHPWSGLRDRAARRLRTLESSAAGGARGEGEAAAPGGPHAVQLGAFAEAGRARGLAERARDAGLGVRIVRVEGSSLVHVRVGRYRSREAAEEERDAIRAEGFEAAVVSDARREEPGR